MLNADSSASLLVTLILHFFFTFKKNGLNCFNYLEEWPTVSLLFHIFCDR